MLSRRDLKYGLVAGLLLPGAAAAANVSVAIEGLEDELLEAARAALELRHYEGREITSAQVRRLFEEGDEQIRESLEPFGYYNARVEGELEAAAGESFRAVYRAEPGPPTVVREAHVRVEGSGAKAPQVRTALEAFEPDVGERLDHAAYEQSKGAIGSALRATGYLDAQLLRHRVAVTRAANAATIDLAWRSGERFRLGEVRFSEAQFPERFLERYVPWDEGEYYSTDALLTLQQRLVDTDYFATVAVQPDVPAAENGAVPIDVLLVPAKRSVYSAAAYLSTDSGPGGRLGFERRWLNQRGHKLRAQTEYSQRLQQFTTSYQIPRLGPHDRRYNLGAAWRDEDTDTSRSQNLRAAVNETRRWRGFTRTLGLQFLDGSFEVGGEQRSSTLLFAEGMLSRKDADDLFFPIEGRSIDYLLRLAPEGIGSDTSLAQLRADGRWVRSIGDDQRLLLRAALGAMVVDDFGALPPELRFFAGGDRSVRGFDYQQIGEQNAAGLVIGGEYLAVASAEYERFFAPRWGAALFVDAGDAFRSDFDVNLGAGIGVRWKSPVGLVRLDFARPVSTDLLQRSWRIHLVIGPDL